jgi:MbtH protein
MDPSQNGSARLDGPVEFRAVVNDEEQYSLLPVELALPPGWRDTGISGSRERCLAFIGERWIDMRPLSTRVTVAGGQSGQ